MKHEISFKILIQFLRRIESEGKTNAQIEANSTRDAYSEVYDWRPSVEKTDVMRTMEAIEGSPSLFILVFFFFSNSNSNSFSFQRLKRTHRKKINLLGENPA